MKQETKDTIIFWFLIAMKVLTSVRTGIDTFIVSGDLLNVVLLDGFFLAFWGILAYGGKSVLSLAVRPVAAIAAGVMYGFMIFIGLNAHIGMGLVSTAVRVGGAALLFYDGWGYIVNVRQFFADRRKTFAEEQRDLRTGFWKGAYKKGLKKSKNEFETQALRHIMTDILTDGDLWASLPVTEERKRLPASVPDDRERPRTTANDRGAFVPIANRDTWATVFPSLPEKFTRLDVETVCGCKKTAAVTLINIGKSDGDIVEVGKGTYRKVQTGEIVEDTDMSPTEGF